MARSSVDGFAAATMLVLSATWGVQHVAVKLVAADVPPVVQIAIRYAVAAVIVAAVMAWRRERPSWERRWRPGAAAGVLFALEFLFIAEALRRTSAGHVAVFLYTAPMFTAVSLHLLVPAERLRRSQWIGIVVAFTGITVAFLGSAGAGPGAGVSAWGDLFGIAAGALWGGAAVVVRTTELSDAPATETLLYQLLAAAVLLPPVAIVTTDLGRVSFTQLAWASVLFQGVVVSFASYLTWFWLLRRYSATGLFVFSYMTPLFGVAMGAFWLGEPLTPAFLVGAALVLAGIAIVSGVGARRART
jgi:drug/metabolite transporter (DMT)-like permease